MLNMVPKFPLQQLREHVIEQLTEAVITCSNQCQTFAGGTLEHLFVPLLKMCDTLLLMGAMDHDHLKMLLTIIHSRFVASKLPDDPKVQEIRNHIGEGLLQMKLNVSIECLHNTSLKNSVLN